MDTETDFDQIARDFIYHPVRSSWGRGWKRLSDDQRRDAIEAAMWRWITQAADGAGDVPKQTIKKMTQAMDRTVRRFGGYEI